MEASVRRDSGFGMVAIVLGVASLLPLYGIAAAPFAILFGVLGRSRVGLGLGLVGAIENAIFVLVVVL